MVACVGETWYHWPSCAGMGGMVEGWGNCGASGCWAEPPRKLVALLRGRLDVPEVMLESGEAFERRRDPEDM